MIRGDGELGQGRETRSDQAVRMGNIGTTQLCINVIVIKVLKNHSSIKTSSYWYSTTPEATDDNRASFQVATLPGQDQGKKNSKQGCKVTIF